MKMKQYGLSFEARLDLTIYAPEDATDAEIERIARDIASDLGRTTSEWDPPEFEAYVGRASIDDVPDENRVLGPPNRYGFRAAIGAPFCRRDVLVVSDERDDFVNPEDARWWVKEAE